MHLYQNQIIFLFATLFFILGLIGALGMVRKGSKEDLRKGRWFSRTSMYSAGAPITWQGYLLTLGFLLLENYLFYSGLALLAILVAIAVGLATSIAFRRKNK